MSNFDFIKAGFPQLYEDAIEAEKVVFVSPTSTAVLCRSTFENGVNWLYEHNAKLIRPLRSDLHALIHEPAFTGLFNDALFREFNLIRKTGNIAAHGTKISEQDALACLKYLFRFLRYLAIYYGKTIPKPQVFDDALIPNPHQPVTEQPAQVQQLRAELEQKNQAFRQAELDLSESAKKNTELHAQIQTQCAEMAAHKAEREKTLDVESEKSHDTA